MRGYTTKERERVKKKDFSVEGKKKKKLLRRKEEEKNSVDILPN